MLQLMGIIGVVFLVLEIFTPAMFFLNLAFASFLTMGVTLFTSNLHVIIFSFVVFSAVMLLVLRPILMNLKTTKSQQTGIESKYIGQVVKTTSTVTKDSGTITIYGERWEARTESDEPIPTDTSVRIIRNESLIMYVEKVTK